MERTVSPRGHMNMSSRAKPRDLHQMGDLLPKLEARDDSRPYERAWSPNSFSYTATRAA